MTRHRKRQKTSCLQSLPSEFVTVHHSDVMTPGIDLFSSSVQCPMATPTPIAGVRRLFGTKWRQYDSSSKVSSVSLM